VGEPISKSADVDDEIDLIKLFRTLWGYKRLIVGVTVAASLIAVTIALTAPKVYRAQTVVSEVKSDGMGAAASLANQFGGLASLAGINLNAGSSNHEALAVLQSRRLAEEFIKRNDLLKDLSVSSSSPITLWKAVNKFKQQIVSVREDKRTGLTTVAVNWRDPVTAAKWANEFVALANELLRARALADATRNITYLNEQISRTKMIELQRVMYNLIENETKTLMLANARAEYAFTTVDPAVVPEIRESPKRTLIVLFGMVVGFVVGCLAAAVHRFFARNRASAQSLS